MPARFITTLTPSATVRSVSGQTDLLKHDLLRFIDEPNDDGLIVGASASCPRGEDHAACEDGTAVDSNRPQDLDVVPSSSSWVQLLDDLVTEGIVPR